MRRSDSVSCSVRQLSSRPLMMPTISTALAVGQHHLDLVAVDAGFDGDERVDCGRHTYRTGFELSSDCALMSPGLTVLAPWRGGDQPEPAVVRCVRELRGSDTRAREA